jgi:hypothetical protein
MKKAIPKRVKIARMVPANVERRVKECQFLSLGILALNFSVAMKNRIHERTVAVNSNIEE